MSTERLGTVPRAEEGHRGLIRVLIVGMASQSQSSLHVFLIGALGVLLRPDLAIGVALLGYLVAAYFLSAAVTALCGGRLVERLGSGRSLRLGALLTLASLWAIALAGTWRVFAVFLCLGGAGGALSQIGGNLLLTREVQARLLGLAFGLKLAAGPAAAMIAGVALPVIGLPLGWRWVFFGAALIPLLVIFGAPRGTTATPFRRRLREGDARVAPLVLLGLGGGCGAGAATGMHTFLVGWAVQEGSGIGFAGFIFSAGALTAILCRVIMGVLADRVITFAANAIFFSLLAGALGYTLLIFASSTLLLIAGAILGFAGGWGWLGLFNLIVVKHNPNAPAAATAITQSFVYFGSVMGALAFGVVVEYFSYPAAWAMLTVSALIAAAAIPLGIRWSKSSQVT